MAAPTAGLHFTEALLGRLERAASSGRRSSSTWAPAPSGRSGPSASRTIRFDPEPFTIPGETARPLPRTWPARPCRGRWNDDRARPGDAASDEGVVTARSGDTDCVIVPGFAFRVIDALITNFHLPRSSLLLLVSAFAGKERILEAYAEAIRAGYRFYSYGDAMLLL